MTRSLLVIAGAFCAAMPAWAASYYTQRLEDPKAVYLSRDNFAVKGDGVADDTDAIQRAINRVQETTDHGILFVPEGRYRLTKNLYVWPGIRLIGYGANRPVFVLGPNTPGYQDAKNESYLVFFAGWRPGVKRSWGEPDDPNSKPSDATPGTFYSAISNIDIEIGDGNPGAVGVRGRYAQHCFLAHMDFRIGSGIAGVHESGNVMEDVRFYGGRYGLWTQKPSPGWQLTLVDAVFEGQREAAILEREAGLTLIRPHFKNVPTAIAIEPERSDELWVKDARMEDISGPAVIISRENGAQTEINMEGVTCRNVPLFALLRDSGTKVPGAGSIYEVKTFSHGLHIADAGAVPVTKTEFNAAPLSAMPAPVKSDLPDLPPRDTWVNVRSLGARGDGTTDDTEALRKAVAGHRALYFPSGKYIVSDTLVLRPDTVLIALHPNVTQLDLKDSTPAFQGTGAPKPMIEAPQGGTNIVIGLGLYTNGINPRAVAVEVDGGQRLAGERRAPARRAWHVADHRRRRADLQQHPHRRSRHTAALGRPVSQPLGHERRRRDVLRHLDAQPLRASRHARLGHLHGGPRLPDVERAPRAPRSAVPKRLELAHLRAPDRRRARRGRLRPAAGDCRFDEHHHRQSPHVSRHQHFSAVPVGGEGLQLQGHPLPERSHLQQQ